MPFTPDPPYPKTQGNVLRSSDWNQLVEEVRRLDRDKLNLNGPGALSGPLSVAGGNWDVGSTDGDLAIGAPATRLKIGVANGGGGAGDVRIRAVGGTNRLMLGSGANDVLTVQGTNVGIGTTVPNAPLSLGTTVANTKLALFDGNNDQYGFGVQSAQLRIHVGNSGARFTFLNGSAGSEIANLAGDGKTVDLLNNNNTLRLSSGWTDFPAGATNRAEISNDTGTFRTLMIVGNRSAGAERRVAVWDRLDVNGTLQVNGTLAATSQKLVKVLTFTRAVLNNGNNPGSWAIDHTGQFTQIYAAFAVLQGYSLYNNNGNVAFNNFGRTVDAAAVPQHTYVRVTSSNVNTTAGISFCQEAKAEWEGDNTVLFTVVIIGMAP